MKENKIASVVLNTIASIFTWTAFGLGISSVTSTAWYYLGSNIKAGLWQVCVNDICSGIPVDRALQVTRSFTVIMIIFTMIGNTANIVSQWKQSKIVREAAGSIWLISALFGVVGTSVYTASISSQYVVPASFFYGTGYAFAWTCVGLLFVSNLLNYFSSQTMPRRFNDVDVA